MAVVAGVIVVYMGIEKNYIDGSAHCSAIIAFLLLNFSKYRNIQIFKRYFQIDAFAKRKILRAKKIYFKKDLGSRI